MCKSREQAKAALQRLRALLAELGLHPKEAKTRIVHLTVAGEGVDFAEAVGQLGRPRPLAPGYPLLVQAGSSEDGKDFAVRYAEAVFTAHQTLADTREFYADLKRRALVPGRDPDTIKSSTTTCKKVRRRSR